MSLSRDVLHIRKDYQLQALLESDVSGDPFTQFKKWWDEAVNSKIDEVNAMTLATCNEAGKPSARIVLLKGVHDNGFVFFTNYESRKGKELQENPYASLVFFWKELERQVRIEGKVNKVSKEESDDYFSVRPAASRLGAWSSPQSQVIPGREVLESSLEQFAQKYADNDIPRPQNWGGYKVYPVSIEFWQGRPNRLHDRILYTTGENGKWKIERLAP